MKELRTLIEKDRCRAVCSDGLQCCLVRQHWNEGVMQHWHPAGHGEHTWPIDGVSV